MAEIHFLPGALEARMKAQEAANRRRKKVRQLAAPLPPPRELTPLDVLNRIAVRMGLPALPPEDAH
jgi:hypothetical protein